MAEAGSSSTALEVELKFPVADARQMRTRLVGLGVHFQAPIEQIDLYFAHPARDFAKTDEAVRIRAVGDQNFITYKGPKVDHTTKTRREIEVSFAAGPAARLQLAALLESLGFSPVAQVVKQRESGTLVWHDRAVEIALDNVTDVGVFLELEIVAEPLELNAARSTILNLAECLNLGPSERRGYLDLLLRGGGAD